MKQPLQPGQDLEAWARTTLRQLPDRRAPASLTSRVLEQIRQQQAVPWYQRPWTAWPLALRWVTALGVLGLFGFLLWGWMSGGWSFPGFVPDSLTSAASALGHLPGALWMVLLHVADTTLLVVIAVLAVAWFATLGLGTTCWRLATLHR